MIQRAGKHTRLDALLKQTLSETHAVLDPPTHLHWFTSAALSRNRQRAMLLRQGSGHHPTQAQLILISISALLIVILKCIFTTTECDSQKHILIP